MERMSTEHWARQDEESEDETQLRDELARMLTKDQFPADRDTLLAGAADADVAPPLIARLARLPANERYPDLREVMVALGSTAPGGRHV